ncbi:hypothetical protein HFN_0044 [Helicobacter fennelliae MRY12-0050]|uniref:Uncharacterized protein n=1 Tax=Helicobacter fennelliae MRY12-0050 TaxID=1325130 RepID=T1DVP7_9HELI|nr:hypothetical protein HFN_0044 [Helicobacter fennelliae MRY12-0050]
MESKSRFLWIATQNLKILLAMTAGLSLRGAKLKQSSQKWIKENAMSYVIVY